jgi:GDPmannose 4,6-dehydratase
MNFTTSDNTSSSPITELPKVAVITGTGQDSKTLTHLLLTKNYQIILTYRRNTSFNPTLLLDLFGNTTRVDLLNLDHSDQTSVKLGLNKVIEKYGKINEIYHLGADSMVGDSFLSPERQIQNNGQSAFYILEWIKCNSSQTKFYFAATSECFGGDPSRVPFNENSILEPRSPYGVSKVLGYNWTTFYRQTYGLYACSGFLFNHSNHYRHPSFFIRRITQSAARISAGKLDKITLGNINFWRDETYADFMVEMMWKMLNNPLGAKDYVVGNGCCYSGEEFLIHAFSYFNLNWKKYVVIDKDRFRPNEVVKLAADPSSVMKDLGWAPNRISFKDHIGAMCYVDAQLEAGISLTNIQKKNLLNSEINGEND